MKIIIPICIIILLISGCSNAKLSEQNYPDRLKYTFDDTTTGLTNTYLCEIIDNRDKTATRAKIAHEYLSKRVKEISEESVKKMMDSEKFSLWSAMKSSASLQRNGKIAGAETEKKYKCTLISAEE